MRSALLSMLVLAWPAVAGAQSGADRLRAADADGNGLISRAEARERLPAIAAEFDAIDANRDGNLSPEELRAHERNRRKRRGDARGASGFAAYFERADTDGNGMLSRTEIKQALPRLSAKFDAIDKDRNGQLTRAELRAYFDAQRAARGKTGTVK